MTKEKSLKNRALHIGLNCGLLLMTCCVIELGLRLAIRIDAENPMLEALKSFAIYKEWNQADDDYWKLRFVEYYDEMLNTHGTIPSRRIPTESHAEFGWAHPPSLNMTDEYGDTYTTNRLGFRSVKEFEDLDRGKYIVMIVGDSFTFGTDADDSDVWPALLQRLDEQLEVVNLGVEGYGTDQIYLVLRKYIGIVQPDLVVAAIFWDDAYRALLSFRRFQKPKFEIHRGELRLTNTPVGQKMEVYADVKKEMRVKRLLSKVILLNILDNVIAQLHARALHRPSIGLRYGPANYTPINEKILQAMVDTSTQYGADFLLTYVPERKELYVPHYPSPIWEFLMEFADRQKIAKLDPRPAFWDSPKMLQLDKTSMNFLRRAGVPEKTVKALKSLKQEALEEEVFWNHVIELIGEEQTREYHDKILEAVIPPYRPGHYGNTEARIMAHAVYETIRSLSSFQEIRRNHDGLQASESQEP